MNRLLFSLPFTCFFCVMQAQDFIEIRGRIIDAQTNEPIESATISFKKTPVGTISNSEGVFELQILASQKMDTIIVSHLGYTAVKKPASSLPNPTIELVPHWVELSEITVQARPLTAREIVDTAFDRLKKNFSQDPYLLKGFFRQASLEEGQYVLLVEAALHIYDMKYRLQKQFDLKERVLVKQVRSSNSHFKVRNLNFFDGVNTVKLLLNWNYTRYENQYVMERENYQIDSILYQDGRLIYQISSLYEGDRLTNRFTMHIDADEFNFIRIKNENHAKPGEFLGISPLQADRSKQVGIKDATQEYQFRQYKERSYLQACNSTNTVGIIDKKSGKVERYISDENLLVVTEIITQGVDFPKQGIMDPKLNIKEQAFVYDPRFWEDYEQVQLTPLSEKQRKDLEVDTPLATQFAQNAKTK